MIKDRHIDLSAKFIEMGRALMAEGHEAKDFTISQVGACMISMSGLLLDDKNMFLFSQMCGLFSSKMVLDAMEKNNTDKETYEDFIKRLNKLREDNDNDKTSE